MTNDPENFDTLGEEEGVLARAAARIEHLQAAGRIYPVKRASDMRMQRAEIPHPVLHRREPEIFVRIHLRRESNR